MENKNIFSKEELNNWFTNDPEKIEQNKQNKNPKGFDDIRKSQIDFEWKNSGYKRTTVTDMYLNKYETNMRR